MKSKTTVAYIDLLTDGFSAGTADGIVQLIRPGEKALNIPFKQSDFEDSDGDWNQPAWIAFLKELCLKHNVTHVRDSVLDDDPITLEQFEADTQ